MKKIYHIQVKEGEKKKIKIEKIASKGEILSIDIKAEVKDNGALEVEYSLTIEKGGKIEVKALYIILGKKSTLKEKFVLSNKGKVNIDANALIEGESSSLLTKKSYKNMGIIEERYIISQKGKKSIAKTSLNGVNLKSSYLKHQFHCTIERDAHHSKAFTSQKVLLTGNSSKANSAELLPSVKICSKNATVKHEVSKLRIKDEEKFYLGTRGIEHKKAENLIIDSFLSG